MAIQITDRPTAVRGRWVCDFAEGSRDMRDLLGGKGANVAEMTRVLGPERVPAGFTITTEACVGYMHGGEPEGMAEQAAAALERLEARAGKRLGDPADPCWSRCAQVRASRCRAPRCGDAHLTEGVSSPATEGLSSY